MCWNMDFGRVSRGKSVAGEFVEGLGLPFDSPKPITDRRTTFIHKISKHSKKIKQQNVLLISLSFTIEAHALKKRTRVH